MNAQVQEAANEILVRPAVVEHVNIEGYWKTKKDILVPSIKRVLDATSFQELVLLMFEAKDNLLSLGVFEEVDMLIDTSTGPSAHPNGFDITFHVKEKSFLTSSTGTHIGNNEGSMLFGCHLNNVFGRAEQVKADLTFGTRTRMSYQLAFFKPTPGNPDRSFTVSAQKSTTDVPMCSHQEATQGISVEFMFPSEIGQHALSWEGMWRNVTELSKGASFAIREQAGHSLKSALKHTFIIDERDNMAMPTKGYSFRLSQELAGLGGDVKFLKDNLEYQQSVEVFKDVIISWSLQGGHLHTLFGTPSKINDRFFLGGPLSVRGFDFKGIGPRRGGDSLGANTYWAAGLHLYTPLPFRPARGGLGDRFKTHFFLNGGNLVSLDGSLPWQNRLNALREKIRWSCGAGLVLLLGIARLELNYCLPFGAQTSDSLNHGIQVGVGINFL